MRCAPLQYRIFMKFTTQDKQKMHYCY